MKNKYVTFFESTLLMTEAELPKMGSAPTTERPTHPSDPKALDNFVDDGTNPNAFDSEGLSPDIQSAFEQLKQDMSQFYHEIEGMRNKLMSANGSEAILNRLTKFQTLPGVPEQYKNTAIELKKLFTKAHESLGSIATTLLSNNIVADNVKSVEDAKNAPKA